MRRNLPVTDVETLVPEHEFIYSRTDLKGVIVEANEAFARISGFEREELIGKPHNIVRHPDMPEAAYADLWVDLKAGRPWRGIVKNRRKDGGYYWVEANVTPVRDGTRIIGFQSVRNRPTREEVAAAADAYRQINDGNSRLGVKHGRVSRRRPAWFNAVLSFPVHLMMISFVVIFGAAAHLAGTYFGLADFHVIQNGYAALAGLYGLVFLVFYARPAVRELSALADWLDRLLTTGNLRARIHSSRADVIGTVVHDTDRFASSIQAIVQGMADVAHQVGHATSRVSTGMDLIQGAACQQNEATVAAAEAVEQVTVSIGEVAEHALSTRDVADQAGEVSKEGAERSERACEAVIALSRTVSSSAEQVERLGRRSTEISQVAAVIKEIADQTNLLALNAAIEAARAGEVGRGFAVVADEVRKLAERTSAATQEISDTIQMIQEETRLAVEGMRAGAEQVEESVQLVHSAQEALQRIKDGMDDTTRRVSGISRASAEQREAVTQLARNVEQVATMTEQNVAAVNQAGGMVHTLKTNVERMEKSVAQFSL